MSQDDRKLPNDVEQLQAVIAAREVAHGVALAARDETIVAHTETISQHETVIAAQHETIEKQLKKLAGLQQQLDRVLRKQYGPQKERIDADQLTLFSLEEIELLADELKQGLEDSVSTDDDSADDAADDDAGENKSGKKQKRQGHGRRPLPDHLPRRQVIHELTDEERLCPCCGKLRQEIGSDGSEQLEFIPASLEVIEHHRKKYACRECEEHVAIAAKPPQPIERGLPGPGLLAHIVLSKYGDYLPLYRQEDILARSGIVLRRSTLGGWIAAAADLLQPLYDLMCDRVRSSRVIHTDDTGIKMLSPGSCRNAKFWTYIGDAANPYTAYEFSLTREGKEPTRFLEGFRGYLQADAFSGYDQIYKSGQVIEVACMAHCRRYWWESKETDSRRAHEAISYIARLYELEEQFREASLAGDALRDARQRYTVPILDAFGSWLESECDRVLPQSPIGKAFTYTRNQWPALRRYTDDGALSIDNNIAERMVKLPAIGRKNWLFVGSLAGGHRAAILLSVIASAKHCGVEPWAWLTAVLKELPLRLANSRGQPPDPDLTDLLPDNWLQSHPEHHWQIDELRQAERTRSRQAKLSKRKR